jgi:hypothetical protein
MANLRLAPTSRYFRSGGPDDYVVLDRGRVIGRVMLHPQAPYRHPWFWTITAVEFPSSVYNKGYSETREQAQGAMVKHRTRTFRQLTLSDIGLQGLFPAVGITSVVNPGLEFAVETPRSGGSWAARRESLQL